MLPLTASVVSKRFEPAGMQGAKQCHHLVWKRCVRAKATLLHALCVLEQNSALPGFAGLAFGATITPERVG